MAEDENFIDPSRFGTTECLAQWINVERCATEQECGCFDTPSALARELFLTFKSGIPESPRPTLSPTVSSAPTATPSTSHPPTGSRRPTGTPRVVENNGEEGGFFGDDNRERKRRNRRRRLSEAQHGRRLDDEEDLVVAGPPTTRPPTEPTTQRPSKSPIIDTYRQEKCALPSERVCGSIKESCCCQKQIDAFANCAVTFVYPRENSFPFTCDYSCPGIRGDDEVSKTFIISLVIPICAILLLVVGASSYFLVRKKRLEDGPGFLLPTPVTQKETEDGSASILVSPSSGRSVNDNKDNDNNNDDVDPFVRSPALPLLPPVTLQLDYAVSSMQGWRRTMEDAHLAFASSPDASSSLLPKGHAIFGVFDGHGGEEAAEFLSRRVMHALAEQEPFREYVADLRREEREEKMQRQGQPPPSPMPTEPPPPDHRDLLEQALMRAFVDLEYEYMCESSKPDKSEDGSTSKKSSINGDGDDSHNEQSSGSCLSRTCRRCCRKRTTAGDEEEAIYELMRKNQLPENSRVAPGTTALIVLLTPRWIVCANVGDSRGVLATSSPSDDGSGATTVPLSYDHKPSDPKEKERILSRGGKITGKRVNGQLAVSRTIGDFQCKDYSPMHKGETGAEIARRQVVSPLPEVMFQPWSSSSSSEEGGAVDGADDLFVVLGCDGIWDVMSNEKCVNYIHKKFDDDPDVSVSKVCERLLDRCLRMKSKDNMTVMIVRFKKN